MGTSTRGLSFDSFSQFIQTDIGAIPLNLTSNMDMTAGASRERHNCIRYGFGLSLDGVWITWNSENLLWLPAEYRPG